MTPGRYTVEWDRTDDRHTTVARGLYFIRLRLGAVTDVERVVVGRW